VSSSDFPFSVSVLGQRPGELSRDSLITVLDGRDALRAQGHGRITSALPIGLYAVRVERAGARFEAIRRHDGPTTVRLPEPQRYSAVPATDTATSHEYYQDAARRWSRRTTAPPLRSLDEPREAEAPPGALFVFARAPHAGYRVPFDDDVSVLGYTGETLAVIDLSTAQHDRDQGWLAFHAKAPAGEYLLRYGGSTSAAAPPREMAVAVFSNWQTQVFMTLAGGWSFPSASVLMGRTGFKPDDRMAQAVDAALAGLQNGTDVLPRSQRQLLLYAKFRNPMLGLVGAHALLQSGAAAPDQLEVILRNLRRLISDAPDVRALELIAYPDRYDGRPFDRPPLLRAGLDAVFRASASHPELVPADGVLERVAPYRYADSPWSTWEPVLRGPERRRQSPPWITTLVQDAWLSAARSGARKVDLPALATSANVPVASISAAYEYVRTTMEPSAARTAALEQLVSQARKEARGRSISASAARSMFFSGSEGERIEALGLMQGDTRIRDFDVALEAIGASHSAFEQYHGLLLAQQMLPTLSAAEIGALAARINEQRQPDGDIRPGTDRWELSSQILAEVDAIELARGRSRSLRARRRARPRPQPRPLTTVGALERHGSESYFVAGEGLLSESVGGRVPAVANDVEGSVPPFRFSRIGPRGLRHQLRNATRARLAAAMTAEPSGPESKIPAGFIYLAQFIGHDLTFDRTQVTKRDLVTPAQLLAARGPKLDLDSIYGAGPQDAVSAGFFAEDALHLKTGATASGRYASLDGFDFARVGEGPSRGAARKALIPDSRNDENLAVANVHLGLIRFHNRVVDTLPGETPPARRFALAREIVVKHYQWMIRTDFLPRVCDRAVLDDVFKDGRKAFEPNPSPIDVPTMPLEFSVAAFRFGHSMIRAAYNWNAQFDDGAGTLDLLFRFAAVSGELGGGLRVPTNWIPDLRRFYDFGEAGRTDLVVPAAKFNRAMRIDTKLANPLQYVPDERIGPVSGREGDPARNLAFRDLTRAAMVKLATGQQMTQFLRSKGVKVAALGKTAIREGARGASLERLTATQRDALLRNTPLWFYILREAELNNGRLQGVGARIVAETLHRAMEASTHSIVRDPSWRPTLGPSKRTFRMVDMLLFAYEGKKKLLNPLGA
jgi:Animal haem peroxidase